jgi:carnitine-CoA ligase
VLLFLPNGLDWLRAWWGISCLGAVMVTVNTAYRGDILRRVCDDSGASVIITNAELQPRLAALGLGLDVVAPEALATGAIEPEAPLDEDGEFEVWTVSNSVIRLTGGVGILPETP